VDDAVAKTHVLDYLTAPTRRESDAAFSNALLAVHDILESTARKYRNVEDTEELTQVAAIGLFRSLATYEIRETTFRSWAGVVARRRIGEVYKQQKRTRAKYERISHHFVERTVTAREDDPLWQVMLAEEREIARRPKCKKTYPAVPAATIIEVPLVRREPRPAPPPTLPKIIPPKVKRVVVDPFARPVRRRDDGASFASITEAAKAVKRSRKHILLSVTHKVKCAGTVWELVDSASV
jgi:hypothetical protein